MLDVLKERENINSRSVGKTVYVVTNYGGWFGEVIDIVDTDTFLVKNTNGKVSPVSIFDIRNPE